MTSKNGKQRRRYRFGKRREKTQTAELAKRLAPLEELQKSKNITQAVPDGKPTNDDTIRVDSTTVKLPEKIIEEEREGTDIFRLDPIVLVILALMLAFIGFIAWQITLMPAK